MSDTRLSKDWLIQNGEKLKIIYSYAVVNKLDINSKADVLSILQIVDPENANEDQIDIYIKMLQLFGNKLRKTIGENLESGN